MAPQTLLAAIDIGASKSLLTVRSTDDLDEGWTRGVDVVRLPSHEDPAVLIEAIYGKVTALVTQSGGRLIGVGVAAPGPVNAETGVVTRSSNLAWTEVPLAEELQRRLGAPARLEDDANTAALGEWRHATEARLDPFVYLTISSGVGSGVVVRGEVVHGAAGNAGEVGHLVIDPAGPRCACGRRGDIESFAGGSAMARRAQRTWPRRYLVDGRPAPRTAEDVYRYARLGDAEARLMVAQATGAIAMALAALAAVIEPQQIVVGGSIGLGQRRLVGRSAALARKRVMSENGRSLDVRPARLGEESVLAGAAVLAARAARQS